MQNNQSGEYTANSYNRINTTNFSSIEHLQNYISELTLYINENNMKYNKNMTTLKQFYETQAEVLAQDKQTLQQEILILHNQNITIKDLLNHRNISLAQKEKQLHNQKIDREELLLKLQKQRNNIDSLYQQLQSLREIQDDQTKKYLKENQQLQNQIYQISMHLKENIAEKQIQQKQIQRLNKNLSERYSLPQKIQDLQIQSQKLKFSHELLAKKSHELQKKNDFQFVQIQKYKKQNENLRISKNKISSDVNLEVEVATKKLKEQTDEKIRKIQFENDRNVYQIGQLQMKLKDQAKQISQLEGEVTKEKAKNEKMGKEVKHAIQEKDSYLHEFRSLKEQYQKVINNLEGSVISFQQKNWTLTQQNQDLNEQLEGLQELLRQVKAMNNLQPARSQYRKWAELEILGRKTNQINKQDVKREEISKQSLMLKESKAQKAKAESEDLGNAWDKLLLEIDGIQI